ncbi:hypothetical protein LTR17_021710 [Elasticomyces elasticus]|nr:hypothetical protein LTR17_021710 [Elasticomyces elasticus]
MPTDRRAHEPSKESGQMLRRGDNRGWLPDEALKAKNQAKTKAKAKHRPGEGRAHQHQKAPGDIDDERRAAASTMSATPRLPKLTNIYEYLYLIGEDTNATPQGVSSRSKERLKTKSPPEDIGKLAVKSSGNDVLPSKSRPHKEHHPKHEGRRNRQLTTPEPGHQSNDIDAAAEH